MAFLGWWPVSEETQQSEQFVDLAYAGSIQPRRRLAWLYRLIVIALLIHTALILTQIAVDANSWPRWWGAFLVGDLQNSLSIRSCYLWHYIGMDRCTGILLNVEVATLIYHRSVLRRLSAAQWVLLALVGLSGLAMGVLVAFSPIQYVPPLRPTAVVDFDWDNRMLLTAIWLGPGLFTLLFLRGAAAIRSER